MITGKTIVLTGANSGIGLEVLKLLLEGDNRILCVDKNTDVLEKYADEKMTVMQCDVSSKEAVDAIFDRALEVLGSIDIFYANAGYPYYEEFNYVDWDRVQRMFETNVFSPIYTYQKYAQYLNGRKGIYAITVSAIGQMAMPGFTVYSASKFAMEGFQQGLRLELPDNIQLTCSTPLRRTRISSRPQIQSSSRSRSPCRSRRSSRARWSRALKKAKRASAPARCSDSPRR